MILSILVIITIHTAHVAAYKIIVITASSIACSLATLLATLSALDMSYLLLVPFIIEDYPQIPDNKTYPNKSPYLFTHIPLHMAYSFPCM